MRADRFTSIAAVITLLATVQAANVASDDGLMTLTVTRTVFNQPSTVPLKTNAPVSDIKKPRESSREQQTLINEPETVTHYITEYYHVTQAPSKATPSVKPMPISSGSPVVIVSASPTIVNSPVPSQINNGEEVVIVTKTKKNKTKLKTKTIAKQSTSMHPVTQTAPLSVSPIQTASISPSSSQQPSSVTQSLVSKSVLSPSVMLSSVSASTTRPLATSSIMSSSISMSASSVPAVSGSVSVSAPQQPVSGLPTMIVIAAPSPSAATTPVNNGNKKINPSPANAHATNGATSNRSISPTLFLAWLMAGVAAF